MKQRQEDGVRVLAAAGREEVDTRNLKELAESRNFLRKAWLDVKLLFLNYQYVPNVLLPLEWPQQQPGVTFHNGAIIRDYILIAVLGALQVPVLIAVVPAFLLLPGWVFVACVAVYCGIMRLICGLMWSKSLEADSQAHLSDAQIAKFAAEKWIFINGICTSYAMLQQDIDLLSGTFQRPVLGIHNRSFGIIGDLLECIIQRSFNYETNDVRYAYEAIKRELENDQTKKVVVIAHSQGGILLSMALNRLYAHVAIGLLSKLELYTFGSAASAFNNPSLAKISALVKTEQRHGKSATSQEVPRAVPRIEHYVNELDLVPRWGVLYHVEYPPLSTATTYNGRVFVHEQASGHLFDQHYLQAMFPAKGIRRDDRKLFANHQICNHTSAGILRSSTIPKGATPNNVDGAEHWSQDLPAGSADGYQVKDLSKLWSYVDGGDGSDNGV